jgi:hypothetical protein
MERRMGRPRKADTDQAATVRIENAFWKLLELERAEDIGRGVQVDAGAHAQNVTGYA